MVAQIMSSETKSYKIKLDSPFFTKVLVFIIDNLYYIECYAHLNKLSLACVNFLLPNFFLCTLYFSYYFRSD